MRNLSATAAALLAVLLFGTALLGMTVGSFRAAGFSFLCASLTIYLRETYLLGD